MARRANNLTVRQVETKTQPGRYADGNGLYLQIAQGGSKSWLFRYMRDGKARAMGLGPYPMVTLAEARQKAGDAKRQLLAGEDPIAAKKALSAAQRLEDAKAITFRDAAGQYIEAHRSGWSNAKHRAQWTSTLETYAYPVIGDLSVAEIDTDLVMMVVEGIWHTKTETAKRVRSRIENILDWCKARDYRTGENPARWRGHLAQLLPAPSKVAKVKHHEALPYEEIGEFMAALRGRDAIAARALEFTILTAARTSEVLNAKWSEISLKEKTWLVRGDRMKARRDHRVPLSDQAVKLLEVMGEAFGQEGFIFPGQKAGRPLSGMALAMVLRRMERKDITVHGFRSAFRDWASETTAFPLEVGEMALSHAISNKTEAAYRRGDLFEKRRRLMKAWANRCDQRKPKGNAVPLQKA